MIDNFSLAITHGLIIIAAWRLIFRPDLDCESVAQPGHGQKAEPKMGRKRA